MLPEVYFCRIAFPCARDMLSSKRISEEEFYQIKNAVMKNKPLEREYLEKTFKNAAKGIQGNWTVEGIKDYFYNKHAKNLPHLNGAAKEFCLVKKAKLVEKINNHFKADLGDGKTRIVDPEICPEVKIGDYVTIHRTHIVLPE